MRKTFLIIMLTMILVVFFGCKPNHEHDYKETKVEPSCTEQGYIEFKCECGDSYKDNFVKAKGHLFGEWVVVKEATVTEEGQKMRTCECGEKETEKIDKLSNSHTHTFGEWVVVLEPTEEAEGLKEKGYAIDKKQVKPTTSLSSLSRPITQLYVSRPETTLPSFITGRLTGCSAMAKDAFAATWFEEPITKFSKVKLTQSKEVQGRKRVCSHLKTQ